MFTNKIKLVATDMDGTLLNSKKQLPSDFKPWVLSHPDIITIIASGRQYYALQRDLKEIKDHVIFIAENGSLVFENEKIIYQNTMKVEDVISTLRLVENIPLATPVLCGLNSAYLKETSDEEMRHATMYYERLSRVDDLYEVAKKETIVKFAIYIRKQMAEQAHVYFKDLEPSLQSVVSGVSWIDVANKGVNKGLALKAIMNRYNLNADQCMAFGDYFNDIEMLQQVKYSYATANAHQAVLNIAAYHTDSNDDEGVMKVLRKL